jgi:flagellar export protein FliJ
MAYKFPLATVLRVRGIIEEREEGILQKILFDISKVFDTLERTDSSLSESETSRYNEILKPSTGLQLQVSYGEVKALKQLRKDLEAQIQKLELERDEQLIVYQAARQNREMLTDMLEKHRNTYNSDLNKREQKTLDDNYIARRGRF